MDRRNDTFAAADHATPFPSPASQGPSSSAASTSDTPEFVPRILDIQQGQVCYVIGTIYMSMPLKPDVLDDLTREVCAHSLR